MRINKYNRPGKPFFMEMVDVFFATVFCWFAAVCQICFFVMMYNLGQGALFFAFFHTFISMGMVIDKRLADVGAIMLSLSTLSGGFYCVSKIVAHELGI